MQQQLHRRSSLGRMYDRFLGKLLPSSRLLGLLGCIALNSLVYWGTQQINLHRELVDITTKLDEKIPFEPRWVFLYVSAFLFWAVNYVLMARQERWYQLMTGAVLAKLLCGAFFLLIPATNVRPEIVGESVAQRLMGLIYSLDPPMALFPSIHCLESWTCVLGVWNRREIPTWYQIFSLVLAVLICISTLLTHQHVAADVLAGVLLAQTCFLISKKRNWGGRLRNLCETIDDWVFG